jgi:hypothetical protein
MTAWQTVHVRVNDFGTGRPTPVLIRFTGPDDTSYAPFGRLTEFATGRGEDVGGNVLFGDQGYACIDGNCEVRLPVGPIRVMAFKGPHYRPVAQEFVLGPGKMALRLSITRWADLAEEGWYSGDTQAFFLSPHAALLEAACQDVNVVNLLALEVRSSGRPPALPNLLAFSGQLPALETAGRLVAVNTLNEHPVLGQLALLNCHRIVYPLRFGSPQGFDDWMLADWCDQCHRKGGLVVAADFFRGERWKRGEIIADLLLKKVDALDVTGSWDTGPGSPTELLQPWYHLLNCGLRVPLVGGSGKDSNASLLGSTRTWAQLGPGEELTYKGWIEAVRAGRTFVSTWALLKFTVNGRGPGTVLDVPAGIRTVHVRAEVSGLGRFDKLEVLVNGLVAAEQDAVLPGPSPNWMVLEADIPIEQSGWLAARCGGLPLAHTSPVYVHLEGRPLRPEPTALAFVQRHLEEMLQWVDREARVENDQQRQRLAGVFQSAQEALAKKINPV